LVVASVTNEDLKRSTNGSLARFEHLPVGATVAPTFFNGKITSIFQLVVVFVANKYKHDGINRHPFDKKHIKLIVDSEGAQYAPATLQVQARNHQTDFQRAASHFNDGHLFNYSIVGFQRVVELTQISNFDEERNVLKATSRLIVDLISAKRASKLIVIYSKRSLYFREDRRIFCEGEWEQQRHLDGHTGLVDFIGLVGLIRLIGLVDFIGDVGLVGINGCANLIDLQPTHDLVDHYGVIGIGSI
jgi:hypothetical protein